MRVIALRCPFKLSIQAWSAGVPGRPKVLGIAHVVRNPWVDLEVICGCVVGDGEQIGRVSSSSPGSTRPLSWRASTTANSPSASRAAVKASSTWVDVSSKSDQHVDLYREVRREPATEYGVSWPTAHRALVAAAVWWLPEPEPTEVLGIDETRFRPVRWILEGLRWKRSDPWLASLVESTPGHPGTLLGLAPGPTGGLSGNGLVEQTDAFRRRIEIVVIDPSGPYASEIRPHSRV